MGENCLVVHDTEQTISVEPFDKTLGSHLNVPIVTAAVAYDCPTTLNTYILFFHQALHIPNLKKHLLCPNQLRHNQVIVNDIPLAHYFTYNRPNVTTPNIPYCLNPPMKPYTYHFLLRGPLHFLKPEYLPGLK